MLEYLIYFVSVLPVVVYPIPYISPRLLSQARLIQCSQLRIVGQVVLSSWYLVDTYGCPLSSWSSLVWFGLLLVIMGQVLNVAVYRQLGVHGVYYGRQYDHGGTKCQTVAVHNGFPFCVSHPMYIGGCLTYAGAFFGTAFHRNSAFVCDMFLLNVCAVCLLVQVYLILMETMLDSIYARVDSRNNSPDLDEIMLLK